MKKWIGLLTVLLCSGCSDALYREQGAEALYVPEQHTYTVSLEHSKTDIATELEAIVKNAMKTDRGVEVRYAYRTARGKALAMAQTKVLAAMGLAPSQFAVVYDPASAGDLTVIVSLAKLVTETCPPLVLGGHNVRRDCFVESMRMKQVAYPKHVLGH
ncbi:hypothetical protein ABT56_16290 [Photobacterium aquae]|uniref:Lipoprotein n=1 Tax=Photobacterium aquae TaxID=1195763 RepID=A0A0J1GWU7_9GAMM|nr:hypothetical protein [Photobacterium aquae]KLV04165.1 hypothetical protein ABT56_16290 [Photobacterium aquae]